MMTNGWGRSLGTALLLIAIGCGDDGDGKKRHDDPNHEGGDGDTGNTGDGDVAGDGDDANHDGNTNGDGDGDVVGDGDVTGDGDTTGDGDDDTTDDGDATGDDKLAKDLTEAEAEALCHETTAGLDAEWTKEQNCTVGAVFYTQDKAACEDAKAQCIAEPDEPEDDEEDDGDDCDGAAEDLKGCSATVGELRTCLSVLTKQFTDLTKLTCDDAGTVSEDDFDAIPAECAPVQEKCPDFFGDEEDSTDTANGNG